MIIIIIINHPSLFSICKKSLKTQIKILNFLKAKHDELVELICFTLMPNHFHFLLKQAREDGIMNFLRNFQNSFAKYLNKRYERVGSVFQNPFKSVLVKNDLQLLHLSRYIHLNPYSSSLLKRKEELITYPWSSLKAYLSEKDKGFCKPDVVLDQFKSSQNYLKFVFNNADYQRNLDRIKHLLYGE